MPWQPHTKLLIFLCVFGLVAFLTTSLGLASDYWLLYSLANTTTGDGGNSTIVRVERVGVWKVCYRAEALPDDGKRCHNIDFTRLSEVEYDDPLYHYTFTVNGKDPLLVFLILLLVGAFIAFVAEALAIICLKKRVKSLYRVTGAAFIIAGGITAGGLIIYSYRSLQLISDWPSGEIGASPYDFVYFGWSFVITWVGAALCLMNSTGYIWLTRVHMDSMM